MEEYADIFSKIGCTIDALRKERGLPKTELARLAGIQECHVRRIILGKNNVTLLTLLKILSVLGMSLEEFIRLMEQHRT